MRFFSRIITKLTEEDFGNSLLKAVYLDIELFPGKIWKVRITKIEDNPEPPCGDVTIKFVGFMVINEKRYGPEISGWYVFSDEPNGGIRHHGEKRNKKKNQRDRIKDGLKS